jgi:hypothetical protein
MRSVGGESQVDFQAMYKECAPWGPEWAAKDGRFRNISEDNTTMPPYDMRMVYWFWDFWPECLLAQTFLALYDYRFQVLWDSGVHPNGQELGFCIVTDYVCPSWEGDE